MHRPISFIVSSIAMMSLTLALASSHAQEKYPIGPDSVPQQGVPQGEIKGPFTWKSEIFPGTVRDYWLYVPAQYDASQAACVMVVQDGLNRAKGWKLPTVMDNLIHKGEMPITIGIFISPGLVPAPDDDAQPRFNRSFEYDSLGDRYARFLVDEMLPEVKKSYRLSDDPNDRGIAGASSGAICAFNVAWERPDQFRRVLSTIGTYVGLRGGHEFPTLVRKMEPKPLRVFLQDGSSDLDIYGGSWWIANQDMLSSFQWAGYDVKHVWGDEGHNAIHAIAIMPDAMRWLWRDYPEPIRNLGGAPRRTDIMIPGEDWQLVGQGYRFTEGPAVNAKGELFFTDIPASRIYKVDLAGKISLFAEDTGKANGLMFDAYGRLLACAGGKQEIVAYDAAGKAETVATGIACNDLTLTRHGIYVTDPSNHQVHLVDLQGETRVVDMGIERPNGIVTSPDQTLLWVSDTLGMFVYSFQIQKDGGLAYREPLGQLHLAYGETTSRADGMAVDTHGRIYVTTSMGLQVCDQLGRVHLILDKPQDGHLSNVTFGGPEFNTLFVTCGDKVFKRKVNATGAIPFQGAIKPPKPRL